MRFSARPTKRRRPGLTLRFECLETRALPSATPALLSDITPGSGSSSPAQFTNLNGTAFFAASDGTHVDELWRSNGTSTGTTLLQVLPTVPYTGPTSLTPVGNELYYLSGDGSNGTDLWRTDGTSAGTVLVEDFQGQVSPLEFSQIKNLTNVNGTLFFSLYEDLNSAPLTELFETDGSSAGTVLVRSFYNPASPQSADISDLTPVGSILFFEASDGSSGQELWRTNGTSGGTVEVRDIFPGPSGSDPQYLTNVGGTLFFTANDGTHGTELWNSDGTCAGTQLVSDIAPGIYSSSPTNLTNVNGTLFFAANDGVHGTELWSSNGTSTGTQMVRDIASGRSGSYPSSLVALGGKLFFDASDNTHGTELWVSDGTCVGTQLVSDIAPAGSGSGTTALTVANGTLYFQASDGTHGAELWSSDGTSAGTTQVADINPGSAGSSPTGFTNVGGILYFSANDGTHGTEPWVLPTITLPVITPTNAPLTYLESSNVLAIDPGLTLTETSRSTIDGATVAITGNFIATEDSLNFEPEAGIAGVYNSSTGVLTLSGTASVAAYQTALQSVTYADSNPTPNTTPRTVSFSANIGPVAGPVATRTIDISTADNTLTFNGSPANAISALVNFNYNNGAGPAGGLTEDASGNLFGTTGVGGSNGDGTVFEWVKSTATLSTLVNFNGTNGQQPITSLVIDSSGDLFGTTSGGGSNGDGTVFEWVKTTATLSTLVNFNNANGANPWSSLTEDPNGNFFGTTRAGGSSNGGTVFEWVKSTGTISTLVNFNGTNGLEPSAGLTEDASGNLFGTTYAGGSSGQGTVFEWVKGSGTLSTRATFNGPNGSLPEAGLIEDSSGNLFGTTGDGGSGNEGTVFEWVKSSGTLSTLVNFNNTNGGVPLSTPVEDSSGNLFGTTYQGGSSNDGTVFEWVKSSGTLSTLVTFNNTNGELPYSNLIEDSGGNLFGTTSAGGSSTDGTVFELPTSTPSDNFALTFTTPNVFQVTLNGVTTSYNTSQYQHVIFNGGPGTETVVVSDSTNPWTGLLQPGSAHLNSSDFVFDATNGTSIYLYGNSEAYAVMSDTVAGGFFVDSAADNYAYLYGNGLYSEAATCGNVVGIGTTTGNYAYVYSASKATASGDPVLGSSITTSATACSVIGMPQVYFVGASDGTDHITLDSQGNKFVETPQFSYVTNATGSFLIAALYAASVTAQASAAGGDTAYFYSYAGNSFTGSALSDSITGSDPSFSSFLVQAVGYPSVTVLASGAGTDTAALDSTGGGTLTATSAYSSLAIGNSMIVAQGFSSVVAQGTSSDTAYLYDAAGSNQLSAGGVLATLKTPLNSVTVGSFGKVVAVQQNGSSDYDHVAAIDFALQFVGTWTAD